MQGSGGAVTFALPLAGAQRRGLEVRSLRGRLMNSEEQKNALREENAQLREQVESFTSKKQRTARLSDVLDWGPRLFTRAASEKL